MQSSYVTRTMLAGMVAGLAAISAPAVAQFAPPFGTPSAGPGFFPPAPFMPLPFMPAPPPIASTVVDPGIRAAGSNFIGPFTPLDSGQQGLWFSTLSLFDKKYSVTGTIAGEPGRGLGPRFNGNSCGGCHAYPGTGGTSPPIDAANGFTGNPQVALATEQGAQNVVPPFISEDGPVRVARFIRKPDGSPDGQVHQLFVITGRSDAGPHYVKPTGQGGETLTCDIQQPDFEAELKKHNVVFRIPLSTFGLGLVENLDDSTLEDDFAASASTKQTLGIGGHFNHSANDGTITRFGWKAQNKSLLMFAGEASNQEHGVTNDLFPNETDDALSCQYNGTPEAPHSYSTSSNLNVFNAIGDVANLAAFMRFNGAPQTVPTGAKYPRALPKDDPGYVAFNQIGCQSCHTESHTMPAHAFADSNYPLGYLGAFSGDENRTFSPYSDFALHNMGLGLADYIQQGQANGAEFRTTPLWGIGKRAFFLHDGRTKDLVQAITAHASPGSEANAVIRNFYMLPADQQQALINFLREL